MPKLSSRDSYCNAFSILREIRLVIGNHNIELALFGIAHKPLKLIAPVSTARNGFVCVYANNRNAVGHGKGCAFLYLLFYTFFFLAVRRIPRVYYTGDY